MFKKCVMKILALVLVLAMLPVPSALGAVLEEQFADIFRATTRAGAGEKPYKLWYNEPAEQNLNGFLTQALHIGNGYMGVSVFGGTDTELLSINENSLFNPSVSNSGSSKVLFSPSGEERPSSNEGGLNLLSKTYLDFGHEEVTNYIRYLSLNDAIAGVSYDHNGVTYTREYFSTYPDKVTVLHLTASQEGALTFTLRPEAVFTNDYLMTPGDGYSKSGAATVSGDTVTVKGTMDYFGINYEGLFKVIPQGGALTPNEENATVTVTGATSATVIIAVGTSYELTSEVFTKSDATKMDRTADPHAKVQGYLDAAAAKSYEALRQAHIDDYREFFDRAQVDLGGEPSDTVPTDERIAAYKNGTWDPYIEEMMFQFGRYMLIASSREGCLPSNLQGIWNFCDSSAWSGGYWHNINVQMNYWPAFNTDLVELFQSYVDYNEAFRKQAQANADSYLKSIKAPNMAAAGTGGNGWAVGTGCNPYRCAAPSATSHSGPGTGAFTSLLFWDYYDFTRDEQILRDHTYPAVEGMAQFLSQTLVQQPDGKWLVGKSASPENISGKDPVTGKQDYIYTVGSAFDQQMVYENHLVTQKAAQLLGYTATNHPILATIEEQINHLDPVNVGWSGQIKEYREEKYYGDLGEPHHRHISQLVGLYPGTSINGTTDAWQEAAAVSLTNRGDGTTGWATSHRQLAWARLQDGENAYRLLSKLISARVNSSMWLSYSSGKHSPFQIESHFGYTTGLAEMLVQSHAGYVEFLPALPKKWASGSFTGLTTRGNFSVDAQWENGQATRLVLRSRAGSDCSVKYPGIANATIVDSKGNPVSVTKEGTDLISFPTTKGESYTITGLAAKGKVSAPGALTLKPNGNKIQLSWTAASNAASYNVYCAVNDEAAYTPVATGVTGTSYSYDPAGLKGTDRMTVRVTAVNSSGLESKGSLAYLLPMEAPEQVIGTMFGTDLQLQIQGETPEGYRIYEDGVLKLETTLPVAVVPNASATKTYTVSTAANGRESATVEALMTVSSSTGNVLLNKPLSQVGRTRPNANYPMSKAVDGKTTATNGNERWAFEDAGTPYTVTADLGALYKLGTLKIYEWKSSSANTRSDKTTVEVLNADAQWQTVQADFGLTPGGAKTVDMGGVEATKIRFTFQNTDEAKSVCIAELTCTGLEIRAVNKIALCKALESYGDATTAKPTVPVAYITALREAKAVLADTGATQKAVDQATLDLVNAMTKANIFLNTQVTTDATPINTYPASKLVDGSSDTRFAMSAGSSNKQSVTFTIPLDGEYHLEAVLIQEYLDATTLSRAKNVILEAYYDGAWTTVFTGKTLTDTRDPTTGAEVNRCGSNAFVLENSVKASQVRFTFEHKNTSGLMTIFELQGYGEKVGTLSLSSSRLTLASGNTHQLTASAAGSWTSSDSSVATVSSTGKLTALATGNATVTFTDGEGNKAQCLVTVTLDTTELNAKIQQAQAVLDAYLPIDGTPEQVITGVKYAPKAEYEALQAAVNTTLEELNAIATKEQAEKAIKQLSDAIAAVEAKANTGTMADNHSHCICGGTLEHTHSAVKWTAWGDSREELTTVPLTAGNYYLVADVTLSKEPALPAGREVKLCLNGHSITNPTDQAYSVAGILNICDCTDDPGTIAGGSADQGGTIFVMNLGTLKVYGGILSSAGKAANGGVLYVTSGGKAYIYGGTIENGTTTSYGGNIYVVNGGRLEMSGGTVRNGSTDASAANIYCAGTIVVSGGKVGGTKKGNGIVISSTGDFTLQGGVLEGSTTRNVTVWDSGTFTMTGGELKAGTYTGAGANLMVDKGGHVSITGGKIGGGSGGDISLALAEAKEGAVNAKNAPELTIRNATIGSLFIADNNLEYDPVITLGGKVVIDKLTRGGTTKPIVNFDALDADASVTFYGESAGQVFGKGSSTDGIYADGRLVAVKEGESLKWSADGYLVTFQNDDGSVISAKTYAKDAVIEIPTDPTKASDNTYTYTFAGWTPQINDVCTGDATYTANYKSTYIDYTVKFLNEDGSLISEKTYHYGDTVTVPTEPTKASDKIYTYAFGGWGKTVSETCAGDATYQASFTANLKAHSHCTCGGTLEHTHSAVAWTAWGDSEAERTSVPLTAGNYYLVADITLPKEPVLTAGTVVNLCLNGFDITSATDQAYSVAGTLSICDCTDDPGTVTGGAADKGAAIFVINKGTVKIYGGIFHGCSTPTSGGVVYVASGGKAYLYGGIIENGKTTGNGGNVYVVAGGYFEMSGGKVRNGDGGTGGSNIYCLGEVLVTGGTISGAKTAHGVTINDNGIFRLDGGLLEGSGVRNVLIYNSATFIMSSGELKAGTCGSVGSNIRAEKGATITITGGKITGAKVSDISLEVTSGTISNAPMLTIRNATVGILHIADNNATYDPSITLGGKVVIDKVMRGGSTKPIVSFETLDSDSSVTFFDETAGSVFGKGSSTNGIFSNNRLVAVRDGENLKWQEESFTVTFLNEDGSVISQKVYAYGATVQIPADPTKAADKTYTYTFSGWDKSVETTCKGEATYKATFQGTYIEYTVKFLNEDGSIISEKSYHYGDTVEVPANPTKAADKTYTYVFSGWDKSVETTCKGEATYKATFQGTYIEYTVKFLNEDGSIISEKTYHYGDTVEVPADPTKASDNTYTYTFGGWDKSVETTCKGEATYKATFQGTYIEYTVKFLNEDGSIISEKTYHYGDTVEVPADPTKASDNTYTYTFGGWDKSVETTCKGEATYKATFQAAYIDYTVKFLNEDGSIISEKTYHYGDTVAVPADPTKAADKTYTYAFSGWDKSVETTCKGEATYKATFQGTYIEYTVKFLNEDGSIISEKTYHYGDTVEVPANPTKAADKTYTYAFSGWDKSVETTCKGEATYKATFKGTYIDYTVKFLNEDGSIISEKTYHYGDTVDVPADPTRENFRFEGWEPAVAQTVTGNSVYTAQWSRLTTPVVPGESVNYVVEHYKADASGEYPAAPTETQVLGGKIGTTVTAEPKTYAGFCLNTQSSVTAGKLAALANDGDILVLKLYYDADANADQIPDRFQKKVTFRIENGKWSNGTDTAVTAVLTLTKDGKWDASGTAALEAPTGMKPAEGYEGGKWDAAVPERVSGTEELVYTYLFTKIAPKPVTPPTGDTTPVGIYLLLLALSLSGMAAVIARAKKKYRAG